MRTTSASVLVPSKAVVRKNRSLLLVCLVGALASAGPSQAQDPERTGYLKGLRSNWVTRGANTVGETCPATVVGRFKREWLRNQQGICGAYYLNYDFVLATPDAHRVQIYEESAPDSHRPSETPIYSTDPMPTVRAAVTVTFPPVSVPRDRDYFMGIQHTSPWNMENNDGGWTFVLNGSFASDTSDLPGRRLPNNAIPPSESLVYWRCQPSGEWVARPHAVQLWIEPVHDTEGVGGSAIAKTTQTSQPGRGTPPDGTIAGFLSGIHPDITGHNTSGRTGPDQFGFCVEGQLVQESIVFFLRARAWGRGMDIPGVRGRLFLDPSTMRFEKMVRPQGDVAKCLLQQTLSETAPPLDIYWQALIIPQNGASAFFSPASIQRL